MTDTPLMVRHAKQTYNTIEAYDEDYKDKAIMNWRLVRTQDRFDFVVSHNKSGHNQVVIKNVSIEVCKSLWENVNLCRKTLLENGTLGTMLDPLKSLQSALFFGELKQHTMMHGLNK